MEAIREICTIKQGNLVLQLPQQFWDCEVEVIVLPLQKKTHTPKKSLCGALHQYAKPDYISQEKLAWQTSVSDDDTH